jgi:hypothetical protein
LQVSRGDRHEQLEHIKRHAESGLSIEYQVVFVPRRSMVCEMVLEEQGVYGQVTVGEFHLDLIPLEEDVLSLELNTCFKDVFLVRFLLVDLVGRRYDQPVLFS